MQTASLKNGTVKIGTRGSKLALAQAHETRRRLMKAHGLPEEAIEIIAMSTAGDRIQDRALSEIGGKGLFTEEIEQALTDVESILPSIRPRICRRFCRMVFIFLFSLSVKIPAMLLSAVRLPGFSICRRARQSDRHHCAVRP
jgi:hypothetical protein